VTRRKGPAYPQAIASSNPHFSRPLAWMLF
jgi:hypothetical protein